MFGHLPARTKSGNCGQNSLYTLAAAGLSGNFFINAGKSRDSLHSKLGELQQRFLLAFFSKEYRFFLTGGAALAGFYLGHRETHDLNLNVYSVNRRLTPGIPNPPFPEAAAVHRQWRLRSYPCKSPLK
jgi:hypothetical protein